MSKICFALLMFVAILTGTGVGAEPVSGSGNGFSALGSNDIRPSGIRFSGSELSVRTGNHEGQMDFGACETCGYGYCADWQTLPWFGSWDDYQAHGWRHGRAGCSTCGQ